MKKTLFFCILLSSSMIHANNLETIAQTIQEEKIYTFDELNVPPHPIDGLKKFYQYIGENLNVDNYKFNGKIRILIRFIIEKDGKMTNVIVKDDGGRPDIAKRAVKVLQSKKCPKWEAGILNGIKVRTTFEIPIVISK